MANLSTLGFTGSLAPQTDQAIRQAASATEDKKIDKSSKDFESILLSSWLQQAQESFGSVPGGEDDPDADSGKDELQGVAMQSLGAAMTAAGGVGIAKMIATSLHKTQDQEAAKQLESGAK